MDKTPDLKIRRDFNQRSFNQIELDPDGKILTKRSRNKKKLIDEIEWYLALPEVLRYAIPRVYDYSVDANDPWLKLEYIPANTIDQFLFARENETTWNSVLTTLQVFLSKCAEQGVRSPVFAGSQFQSMDEMYIQKTFSRIAAYENDPIFTDLVASAPIVNGRQCLSLSQVKSAIVSWVGQEAFQRGYIHGVLHGDLSFSNILFDAEQNLFRVIDPRGDFGGAGIYGDLRYDLAKLLHCSHGHYDFYVNGMFSLEERSPLQFELKPLVNSYQKEICDRVTTFVKSASQTNERDLLFIEGLLFLSMIPLHQDKPQSQKAFLLNGLSILTDAILNKGLALNENKAS